MKTLLDRLLAKEIDLNYAFEKAAKKAAFEQELQQKYFDKLDKLSEDEFKALVFKIQDKYSSKEYRDRWFNRGISPPEELNYLLFNYAEERGRPVTDEEWEKYSGDFTSDIYFIKGVYFEMVCGQGCFIRIYAK